MDVPHWAFLSLAKNGSDGRNESNETNERNENCGGENMRKVFGYRMLGQMLMSLAEACFKADEQQKRGEKVTACGMTDEEIETLCEDYLPNLMNPMMSTEDVKERLGVSDATLNRMVERGDIPRGEQKKRGHVRWWKKWDIVEYVRKKRGGK